MLKAKVTLKKAQLDRLLAGDTVTIRLRGTELEITYANAPFNGFEALFNSILGVK